MLQPHLAVRVGEYQALGIAGLLTVGFALQLLELKSIERVAVQNSVAVGILLKSMQQDNKLQHIKVAWDLVHHSCYPSIAVKHAASSPSS